MFFFISLGKWVGQYVKKLKADRLLFCYLLAAEEDGMLIHVQREEVRETGKERGKEDNTGV